MKADSFFKKYRHLVDIYKNKVFNYHLLGMERADIEQELNIKLFTAIQAYGRKWARFRAGEEMQPIPMEFYLKSALNNRVNDFIAQINKQPRTSSIQTHSFDYSETGSPTEVGMLVVNGINLLDGLEKREAFVLKQYLKGYKKSELRKKFKSFPDINEVLEQARQNLSPFKELLTERKEIVYSMSFE